MNRYLIGGALAACLVSFAAGRYTATSSQPAVKVVEHKNTDTLIDTQKNTHTIVKTVVIKEPSGEQRTETTTDTTTIAATEEAKKQVLDLKETISPPKGSRISVNALIGTSLSNFPRPIYGLAVNEEFIGPVTIGVWGLTNGTAGVSIGVSF